MSISLNRLRQYEQPQRRNYIVAFEVVLFVIVIALLLVSLMTGMNVYRSLSDARSADAQQRMGLTLITNTVRNTDAIDAVGVGNGPEGQALVLTEFLIWARTKRAYTHIRATSWKNMPFRAPPTLLHAPRRS